MGDFLFVLSWIVSAVIFVVWMTLVVRESMRKEKALREVPFEENEE